MKKKTDVLIVSNNVVWATKDGLCAETGLELLVEPLLRGKKRLTLAASVAIDHRGLAGAPGVINDVMLLELGRVRLGGAFVGDAWRYIMATFRLLKSVPQSRFVYAFAPGNIPLMACFICILTRTPFGIYVRGFSKSNSRAFLAIERFARMKSAFIFCTGPWLLNELKPYGSKVSLVTPMSPILAQTSFDSGFPVKRIPDSIVYSGRVLRRKGVFLLLDAVCWIHETSNARPSLVYVGDGKDLVELRTEINRRGMDDYIKCVGNVQNVEHLIGVYSSSEILCSPSSTAEGFPRVFYEALKCGVAIVASDLPQISPPLKHLFNAVFLEDIDKESIASKLLTIIENPCLREKLVRNGLETYAALSTSWTCATHGDQVLEKIDQFYT